LGCDAPEVLEPAKHTLDKVSATIGIPVVGVVVWHLICKTTNPISDRGGQDNVEEERRLPSRTSSGDKFRFQRDRINLETWIAIGIDRGDRPGCRRQALAAACRVFKLY
jgi:hypothetical protein